MRVLTTRGEAEGNSSSSRRWISASSVSSLTCMVWPIVRGFLAVLRFVNCVYVKWLCGFASATGAECDDRPVGDHDAAQAVELVRALRDQLHKMTAQLAWVIRQDVTSRNGRACAMRVEAAALRRDIREAQFLIDRLQRRYLNGDERAQQHLAGRQPVAMAGRRAGQLGPSSDGGSGGALRRW